jgi:hypothetical protein
MRAPSEQRDFEDAYPANADGDQVVNLIAVASLRSFEGAILLSVSIEPMFEGRTPEALCILGASIMGSRVIRIGPPFRRRDLRTRGGGFLLGKASLVGCIGSGFSADLSDPHRRVAAHAQREGGAAGKI